MDLEVERSLLFVQILCPPLPLVCRNQGTRDEKITISNDLMYSIFGRLLMVPDHTLENCFPSENFKGNWRAHILKGKHALELLETMVSNEKADDSVFYTHMCNYCREVIRILVGYDLASQVPKNLSQGMAQSGYDGAGDIRFLVDPGRISFAKYPTLVKQTMDHHMSLLVFRMPDIPETLVESIRKELTDRKDYQFTLNRSIGWVRTFAKDILEYEKTCG